MTEACISWGESFVNSDFQIIVGNGSKHIG